MRYEHQNYLFLTFEKKHITPEYLNWLNDKVYLKYSRQSLITHNLESAITYLATFQDSLDKFLLIKFKNRPIGTCTIHLKNEGLLANVGILIAPEESGKGHGYQIWKILIKELLPKLGITELEAGTHKENLGMLNIFYKSGMKEDTSRDKTRDANVYFRLTLY